jgi:hypothetical protein
MGVVWAVVASTTVVIRWKLIAVSAGRRVFMSLARKARRLSWVWAPALGLVALMMLDEGQHHHVIWLEYVAVPIMISTDALGVWWWSRRVAGTAKKNIIKRRARRLGVDGHRRPRPRRREMHR